MLVLARTLNESVILTTRAGERIGVTVVRVVGGQVRLGFTADDDVRITREELLPPHLRLESLRAKS